MSSRLPARGPPPWSSVHNYTFPMHKDATALPAQRRTIASAFPTLLPSSFVPPQRDVDDPAHERPPEDGRVLSLRHEVVRGHEPLGVAIDRYPVVLVDVDAQHARGADRERVDYGSEGRPVDPHAAEHQGERGLETGDPKGGLIEFDVLPH